MIRLETTYQSIGLGMKAGQKLSQLKQATQNFEAILLKDILANMRKGMPSISDASYTSQMIRDMADQAVAEAASSRGGFGVAQQLYREIAPAVTRQEYTRLKALFKQGQLQFSYNDKEKRV